jgi:hypothetical protein
MYRRSSPAVKAPSAPAAAWYTRSQADAAQTASRSAAQADTLSYPSAQVEHGRQTVSAASVQADTMYLPGPHREQRVLSHAASGAAQLALHASFPRPPGGAAKGVGPAAAARTAPLPPSMRKTDRSACSPSCRSSAKGVCPTATRSRRSASKRRLDREKPSGEGKGRSYLDQVWPCFIHSDASAAAAVCGVSMPLARCEASEASDGVSEFNMRVEVSEC